MFREKAGFPLRLERRGFQPAREVMFRNLVYSLFIPVESETYLKIGSLGLQRFERGWYVYVGSSMKYGLRRICRHLRNEKKLRWHVDYLVKRYPPSHVLFAEVKRKMECEIARRIKDVSSAEISNFGCSDCRCSSHLFWFEKFSDALYTALEIYKALGLHAEFKSAEELLRECQAISRR